MMFYRTFQCTRQQSISTFHHGKRQFILNKGISLKGRSFHQTILFPSQAQTVCSRSRSYYNQSFRKLSTLPKDDNKERRKPNGGKFLQEIVDKLNYSLRTYPAESLVFFTASDIGSVFLTYSLMKMSGFTVTPEFAIAFAVSRPIRKVRLPLDIAAAALIKRAFPLTATVQLSALTNMMNFGKAPAASEMKSSKMLKFLEKGSDKMKEVVDEYGAAYMIGSRLSGVVVIFGLYGAISQGVDVMPFLEKFGVEEVGEALGTWAAAVVLSSSMYPATLSLTGYAAPAMHRVYKSLSP